MAAKIDQKKKRKFEDRITEVKKEVLKLQNEQDKIYRELVKEFFFFDDPNEPHLFEYVFNSVRETTFNKYLIRRGRALSPSFGGPAPAPDPNH